MPYVILGFGANVSSVFGDPVNTLSNSIKELTKLGVNFNIVSSLYCSPAVGPRQQPDFYNLVTYCHTTLHPNKLLKLIKQLERVSGRRGQLYWGARPLDIDIIDYNGQISRRPSRVGAAHKKRLYGQSKISFLTYPHLFLHQRAFVLKPLAEILPSWRHPIYGLSAFHLMQLNCSCLIIKATEKLEKHIQL